MICCDFLEMTKCLNILVTLCCCLCRIYISVSFQMFTNCNIYWLKKVQQILLSSFQDALVFKVIHKLPRSVCFTNSFYGILINELLSGLIFGWWQTTPNPATKHSQERGTRQTGQTPAKPTIGWNIWKTTGKRQGSFVNNNILNNSLSFKQRK